MSQSPLNSGGRLRDLLARRGALPLIGAGAIVLVVVIAIAVLALSGGGSGNGGSTAGNTTGDIGAPGESAGLAASTPIAAAPSDADIARPTVVPTIDPNAPKPGAPGDKITIKKIGVDAPLTLKSVGLDGAMPNPDGEDDLAV